MRISQPGEIIFDCLFGIVNFLCDVTSTIDK